MVSIRIFLTLIGIVTLGRTSSFITRPFARVQVPYYNTVRIESKLRADDKGDKDTPEKSEDKDKPKKSDLKEEGVKGIGGDGGLVYNVNALKRNLLQETIRDYKEGILSFLRVEGRSEQEIVDKLSALVQASPVRTTTDSNLLDGTWWRAFESKNSWVSDLLDNDRARLLLEHKSKASASGMIKSLSYSSSPPDIPINTRLESIYRGKDNAWKRTKIIYRLEELEEDEDPHFVDETTWALGILNRRRRSVVTGLTRRALKMVSGPPQWSLLRCPVFRKVTKAAAAAGKPPPQDLEVLYADVDLCIVARGAKPKANGAVGGPDKRPFSVYTKDPTWFIVGLRPRMRWVGGLILRKLFPFWNPGGKKKETTMERAEELLLKQDIDPIIQEFDVNQSKLRVLKLGDLNDKDDESWDGSGDPFVHLSADERQEKLKQMNVKEIAQAGNKKLATSQRERWFETVFGRRKRFFKRAERKR